MTYDNIFLLIDHQNKYLYVNTTHPFVQKIRKYYYKQLNVQNLNNSKTMYGNILEFNPQVIEHWGFSFLFSVIGRACSVKEIEEFLKHYPEFLEYMI